MASSLSSVSKPAPENIVQLVTQAQDSLNKVLAELKTHSGFTLEVADDNDVLQCSLSKQDELFEDDDTLVPSSSPAADQPSSLPDADQSLPSSLDLSSSTSRKRRRSEDDRLSAKLAQAFDLAPPVLPSPAADYACREIQFVKGRSIVASSKISFRPASFGSFINSIMAAITKVGESSSAPPVIITSHGPKKAKDCTKPEIRELADESGPIVCVIPPAPSSSPPSWEARLRDIRSPPRKDLRRR